MSLKKRKELDGGVAGRGSLLHYNKRLSITQVGSDEAIVISELIGQECSREAYNISQIKIYRNFDILVDLEPLEFEVPMICLVTGCVSRRRDRRYP
jgi:hypothetical protein